MHDSTAVRHLVLVGVVVAAVVVDRVDDAQVQHHPVQSLKSYKMF